VESNPRALAENPEKNADSETRAAPGAARGTSPDFSGDPPEIPPELRRIIAAWPNLPEAVRRGIAAMIEAAMSDAQSDQSRD